LNTTSSWISAWVPPRRSISPALFASSEDCYPQAGAFGERRDRLDVLARENFRWRHQGGLFANLGHRGRRQQRDHGLARSDVTLQQSQHTDRLAQIVRYSGGGLSLR
jgi:hypothetical protein